MSQGLRSPSVVGVANAIPAFLILGMIFLKERLRRAQWIAACLAGAGVAYLTLQFGELPWISLGLAITFGFYGLIRKVAMVGLTIETMFMFLPAKIQGYKKVLIIVLIWVMSH